MRLRRVLPIALFVASSSTTSGFGCTTVEQGADYSISDVVFDENFYYCRVEPMMFARSCGPGDSSQGDGTGNCHFNVTTFKLLDYSPLVGDACGGEVVVPLGTPIPPQAKANYASSSAKMAVNYKDAQLYSRPTGNKSHPRVVIPEDDPDAQIIKDWAQKYSSQ